MFWGRERQEQHGEVREKQGGRERVHRLWRVVEFKTVDNWGVSAFTSHLLLWTWQFSWSFFKVIFDNLIRVSVVLKKIFSTTITAKITFITRINHQSSHHHPPSPSHHQYRGGEVKLDGAGRSVVYRKVVATVLSFYCLKQGGRRAWLLFSLCCLRFYCHHMSAKATTMINLRTIITDSTSSQ